MVVPPSESALECVFCDDQGGCKTEVFCRSNDNNLNCVSRGICGGGGIKLQLVI